MAGKVGVLSGGGSGSGHEPLHVDFVGPGMLDAAVPGPVFAAPTPDQILAATLAVDSGAGVLHLVTNYTGDLLDFGTAAELAAAKSCAVATVVVDDDVAVDGPIGRRVAAGTRTMGAALSACTVPHVGRPGFELPEDEIELGIGIHGEPGRSRVPMAGADEITAALLEPVVADLELCTGQSCLLLVDGLGGTPLAELYVVYRRARGLLEGRGVTVDRFLVGEVVTALDMQGVSISVLKLDEELAALWDAPVHTPALRW